MNDGAQQFLNSYGQFIFIMVAVAVLINLVIGHLVGKAARMKNRSYGSFYWLTLIVGWHLTALIVAALPFTEDDPRNPANH